LKTLDFIVKILFRMKLLDVGMLLDKLLKESANAILSYIFNPALSPVTDQQT